jgi:hypothetical protein
MLEKVQKYLGLLGIEPESATGFVVRRTLPLELRELVPAERSAKFEMSHKEAFDSLEQTPAPGQRVADQTVRVRDNRLMERLYGGMQKIRASHVETGKEPTFAAALDLLGDLSEDVELRSEDSCGKALFSNRDALIGSVARQIARRLVDIEDAGQSLDSAQPAAGPTPSAANRVGPFVAGGAQFLTETYFNGLEYESRVRWSPSSVPSGAGFLAKAADGIIPYFVTGEALNGGFELGYLPTWHLWGSGSGFTAPLAPLSWSREQETLGARAGLGYVASGRLSIFSRLEATSYFRFDYDKNPDGWFGGEVA